MRVRAVGHPDICDKNAISINLQPHSPDVIEWMI